MAHDKKFSFDDLLGAKVIPSNSKNITNFRNNESCITMSEFLKLPDKQKIRLSNSVGLRVIADNAVWVSEDSIGNFSYDNKFLWRTSKGNRIITKCELKAVEDSFDRNPLEVIPLIKNNIENNKAIFEEENKMSTDQLLGKLEAAANKSASMQQSTNFSGTKTEKSNKEKKEEAKRKRDAINLSLSAQIKDIEYADASELIAFNYNLGKLHGYVVGNDKKIVISAPKKLVTENGKKVLVADASPAIKAAFEAKEKVASEFFLKRNKLVIREQAPSTPIGMIFSMPEGGMAKKSDFTKAGTVIPVDESKKNLVTVAVPKDEAIFIITQSFGQRIKEDPITHGAEAGELSVKTVVSINKENQTVSKPRIETSNRKRLITPTNYLPQKRYKTISLADARNLSPEEKSNLNKGLFFGLFKDDSKIWKALSQEDQQIASLDNGKYSSVYIDEGRPIIVAPYNNPEATISNPLLPVKEFKVSKSTQKETASFAVYDILKPNPELEHLSPAVAPEFEAMRKALGNGMTVEAAIKACVKTKAKAPSGSTVTVSQEDAVKLMSAARNNKLADFKVEGIGTNAIDAAFEALTNAKLSGMK